MLSNERIATLKLWVFTWWKIPMVFFCRPSFVKISDDETVLKIKLKRRTKNHVNSMYVGALVVGAELSALFPIFNKAVELKRNIPPVVKDLKAEYYARAMGDVHFSCKTDVNGLIQEAIETKERVNKTVEIIATCPDINDDPVAKFYLTLSIKDKTK